MKSILIFIFLLFALTVDVPAEEPATNYNYAKPELSTTSGTRHESRFTLTRFERANNALAIIYGRPVPYPQPEIVFVTVEK